METATITLTYISRVEYKKTKMAHAYLENGSEQRVLYAKKLAVHSIGAKIECVKTETGVKAPYNYLGHETNNDLIRKWINRDQAVADQIRTESQAARNIITKYDSSIEIIKKSYRELAPSQKQMFINRLIIEITR